MRPSRFTFILTAILGLHGCALSEPPDFRTASALGPLAIGDHLVLGDADANALVILDLADGALVATRRVPLAGAPSLIVAAPNASTALVLSREDRTLAIVATDSSDSIGAGDPRSVALGAPFEGLVLSPDGDIAIAYYPPGTANAVFHNENEIAVVDLAPAAPTPVTRRTLASLGGAPLQIKISPRVGDRRFAFVLSEEHVAVMALDDPAMAERSVPLVSLTTGGNRTPTGVVFATDTATLWAIVSTEEANSVYALAVVPTAISEADGADFDVRLSQLAGVSPGGAATLVALGPTAARALYTLTTSPAAGTLTLTDIATATGKTLTVQAGVDRLLLFDGEAGAPMALTWSSHNGYTFHVVDLDRMAAGANKAFESRTARDAFSTLIPIPATSRFIALHASEDEGVSVIDATSSRVTGFGRTGHVVALQLSQELDRLFLLTRLGFDDFLVSVDLASLHPEVARVPDGADALAVLPGVTTVSAVSYREGGRVTLWPAFATADDTTRVVSGFLLDRLFNR